MSTTGRRHVVCPDCGAARTVYSDTSVRLCVTCSFNRRRFYWSDDMWEENDLGCWIWQGRTNGRGYATLGNRFAHRVSYERHIEPIPSGYDVHHHCRERACVNPDHLEAMTHADNVRLSAFRGICVHGHVLDAENTYIDGRGYGTCKTCRRRNNLAYEARNPGRRKAA